METGAGTELKEAIQGAADAVRSGNPLSPVMENMGTAVLGLAWKLALACVIFLAGRKLIAVLRKMMNRSLDRAGIDVGVAKFLRSMTEFCLNAFLVFLILGQLGMDTASIIAILGAAGLALSLSLQESLANLAGGIVILVMKPFRVGDYIVCTLGEGTVSAVGLVYTTLMTVDNRAITIPNGVLSNSTVTNTTAMEHRRLDLTVGISYTADLKKAKEILEQIYRAYPAVEQEKELTVYVDSLGERAVILGARGWVSANDYWQARWDITEQIKLRFDEEGIGIPYRQQLDLAVTGNAAKEEDT